jgi:hypothetical protein
MSEETATRLVTSIGQIDLWLVAIVAVWAFLLFRRGSRRWLWPVVGLAALVAASTDLYAFVGRPDGLSALALFWAFVEMPIFFAMLVTLASLLLLTVLRLASHLVRGPTVS